MNKTILCILFLFLSTSFAGPRELTPQQVEKYEQELLENYEETKVWFNGLTSEERDQLQIKIEKKATKAMKKRRVMKVTNGSSKKVMFCLEAGIAAVVAGNTSICRYNGKWATIQSIGVGYGVYTHTGLVIVFNPNLTGFQLAYSAGAWFIFGGRYFWQTNFRDKITQSITLGIGIGVDFSSMHISYMDYL